MTDEKKKSGAGKFFLGALLGAAAGAIAGRFVGNKTTDNEDINRSNLSKLLSVTIRQSHSK